MLLCAYDVIFLSVQLDPALYVVHGHIRRSSNGGTAKLNFAFKITGLPVGISM